MPEVHGTDSHEDPNLVQSSHPPTAAQIAHLQEMEKKGRALEASIKQAEVTGTLQTDTAEKIKAYNLEVKDIYPDLPQLVQSGESAESAAPSDATLKHTVDSLIKISFVYGAITHLIQLQNDRELQNKVAGDLAGQQKEQKAAAAAGPGPAPGSSGPKWFAQENLGTVLNMQFQVLARTLSDMAKEEVEAALNQRQIARELVQSEMENIRLEGALKKEQFEKLGYMGIASAGIDGLAATASYFKNRGTPPAAEVAQRRLDVEKFGQTTSYVKEFFKTGIEAGKQFIQASYAPQLATTEAQKTLLRDKYEATSGAQRSAMEYLSKSREALEQVLQKLTQMLEAKFRITLSRN